MFSLLLKELIFYFYFSSVNIYDIYWPGVFHMEYELLKTEYWKRMILDVFIKALFKFSLQPLFLLHLVIFLSSSLFLLHLFSIFQIFFMVSLTGTVVVYHHKSSIFFIASNHISQSVCNLHLFILFILVTSSSFKPLHLLIVNNYSLLKIKTAVSFQNLNGFFLQMWST